MSTDTATLLGEHEAVQFSLISQHGPWHLTCSCEGWSCECDDPMALTDGECITDSQHRAHLAAVIDAHTAQVVRKAAETAWDDLHEDICGNQDWSGAWLCGHGPNPYRADKEADHVE